MIKLIDFVVFIFLILVDGSSASFFSLVHPSIFASFDVSIFPPGNPNVPS